MNKTVRKIVIVLMIGMATILPVKKVNALSADQLYIQAYNATIQAISLKTQISINDARSAIDKLRRTKAAWAIGEFSQQVDCVQQPILVNIINSIIIAEKSPSQININHARNTISRELPTIWKNSYSTAIDKVQQKLINNAMKLYNTAETTKIKSNVEKAIEKFKELQISNNSDVYKFSLTMTNKLNELLKVSKDVILFGDKEIEKIIRDMIYKPKGDIFFKDVEKITDLQLYDIGTNDLTGLEKLSNLRTLELIGMYNLRDIRPLQALTKLESLKIRNAINLQNISSLYNLKKLKNLQLDNTNIRNLDGISKLTNLEELVVSDSKLYDLEPLKNLKNLKDLDIRDNIEIKNLSPLGNLLGLKTLYIGECKADDLLPLENLSNLQILSITNYTIGLEWKNTDILKKLVNLREIRINLSFEKLDELEKVNTKLVEI